LGSEGNCAESCEGTLWIPASRDPWPLIKYS
jgi:hypothetical protein